MTDSQSTLMTPTEQDAFIKSALLLVQKIFKGNGVKSTSIAVTTANIRQYHMNAGTYLELRPAITEKTLPGKTVVGRLVAGREEAQKHSDQAMRKLASDATMKARIADVLLKRKDQGFGLVQAAIPLDFVKEDFSWTEGCQTCQGNGKGPCPKCQGRRTETCIKCTGRGMMPCPLCRTTGMLQGVKCTRCHGQRYVACDACRHSGMMPCRLCGGAGVSTCQTCNGQGWKTHIMTLAAQGITYFEYDGKSVPKAAADVIETKGAYLAEQGTIKIKGRIADDKENALGASYEVTFPYGDIDFQIGKREAKAHLFGYKAEITQFPHLLDKMLAIPVEDLERAATDVGDVANSIKKATRYRLIAQAYLGIMRNNEARVVKGLMSFYEFGLGEVMAEKIVHLANITTGHITKKPQLYGFLYGTMFTIALMGAYYLLGLNTIAAGLLSHAKFDVIFDMLLVILGGIITSVFVQTNAAAAIKTALGHLIKSENSGKLIPKAGVFGLAGYVAAFCIAPVMMEISHHMGNTAPYWYEWLRGIVVK